MCGACRFLTDIPLESERVVRPVVVREPIKLVVDSIYLYRLDDDERKSIIDAGGYDYPFSLVRIKRREETDGVKYVRIQRWQLDVDGTHKNKAYLQTHENGLPDFVASAWGSVDTDKDGTKHHKLHRRENSDERFVREVKVAPLTTKPYPVKLYAAEHKSIGYWVQMWKAGADYDVAAEDVF